MNHRVDTIPSVTDKLQTRFVLLYNGIFVDGYS